LKSFARVTLPLWLALCSGVGSLYIVRTMRASIKASKYAKPRHKKAPVLTEAFSGGGLARTAP